MTSIPLGSAPASTKTRASATSSKRKDAVPTFGVMWTIMRSIGDMSLPFFFSRIHIASPHLVPDSTTPLIVCSNHSNTILDVAILASHFPDRRPLHFWAKAGFFKNTITRFIFTSSGNIKVDRRNKNNQALFEGTFEAMKAGGAIALFPEGGSYTIPKLARLKMGAAWAALEYSRYLQNGEGGKTGVKILPTAVVFDDKSKFRSRAVLKFGQPLALDGYIEEFLSAPPPTHEVKGEREDGTVPATPESMTRSNTATSAAEEYASPAHRAVARLTADLQRAMEELTFNAPNWETFQAVRLARELTFEGAEGMDEYVDLSRALMTILTLDQASPASEQLKQKSQQARRSLFVYSSLLHLADVDNDTLARTLATPFGTTLKSLVIRLPIYAPIFAPTLLPTYIIPNALAHHYAGREEESLSSVKTLFSFFFTSMLYSTLFVKTMAWSSWSPPGLLVGMAGVWWLHDLNRSCVDGAYGLVKRARFGWRVWRANVSAPAQRGRSEKREREGKSLFFYGTLVHPKILARVIGNDGSHLQVQNAVLDGAKRFHVKGAEYPGLLQAKSTAASINAVKGTLVTGLTPADLRCLDAFEGDEYTRLPISVIPDPHAPIQTNSTRIANAGTAPLHAILSSLTKSRIAELCSRAPQRVDAEVYTWSAGTDKLESTVWEFDAFAQTHAANWVGEGEVEHEHEYQVVDRVRSVEQVTATPVLTSAEEKEEEWVEEHVATLVGTGRVREAVVAVCRALMVQPSVQFYVDRAFERNARPSKGDRELLSALFTARERARREWEELVQMVDGTDAAGEAVALLSDAKSRVLVKSGNEGAAWPFTQVNAEVESKKTV